MSDEKDPKIIETEYDLIDDLDATDISEFVPEEEGLVIASEMLPSQLPIIPLRPRPSFPGLLVPLALSGSLQIAAVRQAMDTGAQSLGLIMVREMDAEDSADNLGRFATANLSF